MKKWKSIAALGLAAVMTLGGCGGKAPAQRVKETADANVDDAADGTIDKVVWFSDVDFWNPPAKWDTSEDTITGGITKATGLEFEMNIPAGDGSTKLALMIVNGNLPDIMSLTDSTTIKELVDSGKVWQLEEFLQTYDPESHLLNGGYAEDIKKHLTRVTGTGTLMPAIRVRLITESYIHPTASIMTGIINTERTTEFSGIMRRLRNSD